MRARSSAAMSAPFLAAASRRSAKRESTSATAVLSTMRGRRDRLRGADHAELELVAGEGEGARAVAVGEVLRQLGQGGGADLDLAAFLGDVGLALGGGVEEVGELVAEEDGDDRGRRLVAAEAEVVAGGRHGGAQLGRVAVHRLDGGADEDEEARVGSGVRAGLEEVDAGVGAHGPVDVLARAVDAVERLLVQQGGHSVAGGDGLHRLHDELVASRRRRSSS